MADNDLSIARALQAAHQTLAVNIQAAGAAPSTQADRLFVRVNIGDVVFDPVTGQYGTVEHASSQDVYRTTPQP